MAQGGFQTGPDIIYLPIPPHRRRRGSGAVSGASGIVTTPSPMGVASSAAINTVIATLSVPGGTGTYTYTLTSNPGSLFNISGNQLRVNAALTVGTDPITIHADNGAGSTFDLTTNVFVINPVTSLSSSTVQSNAPAGTFIGNLSTAGGLGSYTYTFTSNPGGLFQIVGNQLQVAAPLSAGTDPITVHSNNGIGSSFDTVFNITVNAAIPTYYYLGF